jgi:hypothetical protein
VLVCGRQIGVCMRRAGSPGHGLAGMPLRVRVDAGPGQARFKLDLSLAFEPAAS